MIHLNQVGYQPSGTKKAALTIPSEYFEIIDTVTGDVVYKGKPYPTSTPTPDPLSRDRVLIADFSDFTQEGNYRIRTTVELSPSFNIAPDVYKQVKIDMLRSFYYQRCGCALLPQHAGIYSHGCCHTSMAMTTDGSDRLYDVTGGWHDAGDFGRYVTPGATALAHMLYAYELFPEGFKDELNIPETGNGMPDLLNECKYELDWLLKMQLSDGRVFHKTGTWRHAPFVMPDKDVSKLYCYDVSSMAIGAFAAVTALAARIYVAFDENYAKTLTEASKLSYSFLKQHPEFIPFNNPMGSGTGEYGDFSDRDERYWAAAELYRLTGEACYFEDFLDLNREDINKTALGYSITGGFAALSFITHPMFKSSAAPSETMTALYKELLDIWLTEADHCLEAASGNAYRVAMREREFHWGSNMLVMCRGIILIVAYMFTDKPEYCQAALDELHYLLGHNATGYSFVTGHGEHAYNHPHLRSAQCDGIAQCIPGFVSGGPNGRPCPHDQPLITQGLPPMKSYADNWKCYSLNEVTIYWNSPAVFVAAFFDRKKR